MNYLKVLLLLILLLAISGCSGSPVRLEPPQATGISDHQVIQQTPDSDTAEIETEIKQEAESETEPIINSQIPNMLFGTESRSMTIVDFPGFIGESGMQLVRHNGLDWSSVESTEGERQWQLVADQEEKLKSASASGLNTILIVRGTPEWAQMIPGSNCGPIKPDKLASFASFISEAVARYRAPPYNVKYWELGNEPDVDPSLVPQNSVFGCWGDINDQYYGGGYYAEMLKAVYPAIKAADPEAVVLIGGLLLDCDPTHVPEGKDCTPGKFLEGILASGGGDSFDAVSFHGYAPYFGPESGMPTKMYFDDHHPSWEHRGGVVIGKVDFLREVMADFNLNKPIYHTEGALLCPEQNPTDCDPPGDIFFETQADYAIRMFVRNWADGVAGTIWFSFEGPGWRYGGLLDDNQIPKPVYRSIDFLTTQLSDAQYVSEVRQFESIEGYEFISPEIRTWILWSPEEQDIQIQLPEGTSAVLDKYGNPLSVDGNRITVNSPVYIILPKN